MNAAPGYMTIVNILAKKIVLMWPFRDKLVCQVVWTLAGCFSSVTFLCFSAWHRGLPLYWHWVDFFPSVELQNGLKKGHQGFHHHSSEKPMGDILVFGELSLQSLKYVCMWMFLCVFNV